VFLPPLGDVDNQTIGVGLEMILANRQDSFGAHLSDKSGSRLIMTDFSETDIAEWRLLGGGCLLDIAAGEGFFQLRS
jgi:hypothetical protein